MTDGLFILPDNLHKIKIMLNLLTIMSTLTKEGEREEREKDRWEREIQFFFLEKT